MERTGKYPPPCPLRLSSGVRGAWHSRATISLSGHEAGREGLVCDPPGRRTGFMFWDKDPCRPRGAT